MEINKKKVLIVVGGFPIISQTFIMNQMVSLLDEGFLIKIFSYKVGDLKKQHHSVKKYDLLNKVTYRRKPFKSGIKRYLYLFRFLIFNCLKLDFSLLFYSLNFFKHGKKATSLELFFENEFFIKNNNFDIIHVHFGVNAKQIVRLKEHGFLKKSKLIVSFHGFDLNPSKIDFYKTDYKLLFKHANFLTVNTVYTQNILLEVNSNLKNIVLLPESYDANVFNLESSFKKPQSKTFKIVYCGRLVPFKGSVLLPKIVLELHKRNIKNIEINVIGDGVLKDTLQQLVATSKLTDHIKLLGVQSQKNIADIFKNSHAFLLPGVYDKSDGRAENQGLVIQEAAAMGLPVIVSDVGGMKYGLIPNETGIVVAENDIEGFADAVQKLIENPAITQEMGAKGREYAVNNYNAKYLIKKLIKVYNRDN
ncbi:MAG: glycosyltransferase [Oceanihabitans sp.]